MSKSAGDKEETREGSSGTLGKGEDVLSLQQLFTWETLAEVTRALLWDFVM